MDLGKSVNYVEKEIKLDCFLMSYTKLEWISAKELEEICINNQ